MSKIKHTALGPYSTGTYSDRPILVPETLTKLQALEMFDRRNVTIYIVPKGIKMRPEDIHLRSTYSFNRNNWYRNLVPKAQQTKSFAAASHHVGVFDVFDQIMAYALKQNSAAMNSVRPRYANWLEFYRFVMPEIQIVDTKLFGGKPKKGREYELRYSDRTNTYYCNWYI